MKTNKKRIELLSKEIEHIAYKLSKIQVAIDKLNNWLADKENFQNKEREDVMNFLDDKVLPTIKSCDKHLAPKIKEKWIIAADLEWFDSTVDKLLAAGIKNPVPRVVQLRTIREGMAKREKSG